MSRERSRRPSLNQWTILSAFCLAGLVPALQAGALENYVDRADNTYAWKKLGQSRFPGGTVYHLQLTSQQWRDSTWTHDIQVVCPDKPRNPGIGFLLISGDGNGTRQLGLLQTLAGQAGALAAVVTRVPNQPLYDGLREDALISFTFMKYLETGDESWPLLFPMVKSATRAMDAVQEFAASELKQKIDHFVVGGASKRGWTTWLTAAVDKRVNGIAPMAIDILNMKAQLEWTKKVYGRQSEMIHDYTDLRLNERMDEPRMVNLRSWVDPYSYLQRYQMPKLLLLGANDPYWTVDSLRLYWEALPGPKLVYITPNAGHDLAGGKEAMPTLAAFYEMIADGRDLPEVNWQIGDTATGKAEVSVTVNRPPKSMRLWTAQSPDRDFRNDRWTSSRMEIKSGSHKGAALIRAPQKGYRAYMAEVVLMSPTGQEYKLSTEARVTPDNTK